MLTQVMSLYSPMVLAVTDLKDRNLEFARRYGATHTYKVPSPDTPTIDVVKEDFPDGFDIVIPCLLEGASIQDALACTRTGGKIVMYGGIGTCKEPFDFFKVHRQRVEILSTEPKRDIDMYRYFKEGISLVRDGIIKTWEYIDKIYPLSRIQEAFEERDDKNKDSIHIVIDVEK